MQSESEEVVLEDSLLYLDRRLLALGWHELRPLFLHIHRIADTTIALRDLTVESKTNGVALSAPQQLKMTKIHDAVQEHLPVISIALPVWSEQQLASHQVPAHLVVKSSLPDRQYLVSFCQRLKTKAKSIEEMLISKKLENCHFAFSGRHSLCSRVSKRKGMFDISLLRKEIHTLQELLDTVLKVVGQDSLSVRGGRFDTILQYFDVIKQQLHSPWQEIVLQAADLPELETSEESLQSEMERFQESEERYLTLREDDSNSSLSTATALKSQEQGILEELLMLLRDDLPQKEMLQSLERVAEMLEEKQTAVIDALLRSESRSDLASALSSSTNEVVEAALRAYAQAVMHIYQYTPHCNVDDDAVRWIRRVESFDWGFFLGLSQLWRDTMRQIDEELSAEAVLTALQALQLVRDDYQSSRQGLHHALREYRTQLKKHEHLSKLVRRFRDRFIEMVDSELHQKIDVL